MKCFIYKSSKREQLYLYLAKQDDFAELPAVLMDSMGTPQFVMELEISPERKLARARAEDVIASLNEQGFYLQMPPKDPLHDLRGGGLQQGGSE